MSIPVMDRKVTPTDNKALEIYRGMKNGGKNT